MMDLTPVVMAMIALVVALVTAIVLPAARAKWGDANVNEFLRWVKIGVQAAEQIYELTEGGEKKRYVLNFLEAQGYNINEAEVDSAIEAAVLELHTQLYGVKE
jgi:hypothetical protein